MLHRARQWALPTLLVIGAIVYMSLHAIPRIADGSEDLRHVHQVMPDEHQILTGVWSMVERGDIDYRVRVYPGLYPYFVALVRVAAGTEATAEQAIELTRWTSYFTMLLALLVPFVLLAQSTGSRWVAATFTAALALNPETVTWASRVHPDAFLIGFDHGAIALLAWHVRVPDPRKLAGATILAALSAGTKIIGAFIMVAIAAWIVWQHRRDPLAAARALLLHGLIFIAVVVATTPRLLVDPAGVIEGFVVQHHRNRRGSGGVAGWVAVATGARGLGFAGCAIAALGLASLPFDKQPWRVIVAFFALVYGAFVVLGVRLNLPRYASPALWPLALLGLAALRPGAVLGRRAALALIIAGLSTFAVVDLPAQRADLAAYAGAYERSMSPAKRALAAHLVDTARSRRVISSPRTFVPEPLQWHALWSLDDVAFPPDGDTIVVDDLLRRAGGRNLDRLRRGEGGFVATATIAGSVVYVSEQRAGPAAGR